MGRLPCSLNPPCCKRKEWSMLFTGFEYFQLDIYFIIECPERYSRVRHGDHHKMPFHHVWHSAPIENVLLVPTLCTHRISHLKTACAEGII